MNSEKVYLLAATIVLAITIVSFSIYIFVSYSNTRNNKRLRIVGTNSVIQGAFWKGISENSNENFLFYLDDSVKKFDFDDAFNGDYGPSMLFDITILNDDEITMKIVEGKTSSFIYDDLIKRIFTAENGGLIRLEAVPSEPGNYYLRLNGSFCKAVDSIDTQFPSLGFVEVTTEVADALKVEIIM